MKKFELIQPKEIEFQGEKIKIKQFLSFIELQTFVEMVVSSFVKFDTDEDSKDFGRIVEKSIFDKELRYVSCIISLFTDIEISDEDTIGEVYNTVIGSGLYDEIIGNIPENVLYDIDSKINSLIYEIETNDSKKDTIENTVSVFLDGVLKKLPDSKAIGKMAKDVTSAINKMKPESLKMLGDVLKFNNGVNVESKDKVE